MWTRFAAKSMAGAMDRAAKLGKGKTLLYIHTGGMPGVFAYPTLYCQIGRLKASQKSKSGTH
ncbi:MAG: hypothetical protein ACNYPI_00575 [Arenicellales bacterium WSBS_2016_MAG_OTU3]